MLDRHARSDILDAINKQVHHLTIGYQSDGLADWMPSLLKSLEDSPVLATPVAPPRHPDERQPPRQKPSSRPPMNIGWISDALEIKMGAVSWDCTIRNSYTRQRWPNAFRSISASANLLDDDELRMLRIDVDRWHRSAEIQLGYVDPVRSTPQLYTKKCLDCGVAQIYGVALAMAAWCYSCGSEYTFARIKHLIRKSI